MASQRSFGSAPGFNISRDTFWASRATSDASFNSGSLNWTPAEDQLGSFSMTISVSDGTDKAEMKTSILVLPKPAPAPPDTTVQ